MAPDNSMLKKRGRILADRFFVPRDRILIERHRELKKMEETRQALSAVSGITNQRILQRLVDLDIHPEIAASLAVVPLVAVAWADGRIDEKERRAILQASAASGPATGTPDQTLLEQWLTHRPAPKLLEAWTHYIEGLCELVSAEERNALRADLLDRARAVADAAGGFLGLTSRISEAERRMLEKLAEAFGR